MTNNSEPSPYCWKNLPEIGSLWVIKARGEIVIVESFGTSVLPQDIINYRIMFYNNLLFPRLLTHDMGVLYQESATVWLNCYRVGYEYEKKYDNFIPLDLIQFGILWQNFQQCLKELKQILK